MTRTHLLTTAGACLALASLASAQNDECWNAITVLDGLTSFNTNGSSSSSGWPCGPGGRDIWFTFTAEAGPQVVIRTCGSSFDTMLEVFSGDCHNLISLACSDDACQVQSAVSIAQPVAGQRYFARVGGYAGDSGSGVLDVFGTMPPVLGTNYCLASDNSTGVPAVFAATGSKQIANNDLVLGGVDLPNNSFAYFLTSQVEAWIQGPGGSSGNLCLGNPIGRYVGMGQIQNSGMIGSVSLAVDLAQHPQPTGFVSVLPGETWSFQCWFRDTTPTGSPTSNFTDGYRITFE